jgi:hypothetical protein
MSISIQVVSCEVKQRNFVLAGFGFGCGGESGFQQLEVSPPIFNALLDLFA